MKNLDVVMKRFLTIMACLIAIATAYGQDTYYWYYQEQIPLTPDDSQYFIVYDNQSIEEIIADKDNAKDVVTSGALSLPPVQLLTSNSETYKNWNWALVSKNLKESIENNHKLIYTANSYKMENGNLCGLSNVFYVKLRDESDASILKTEAEKYGVDIIGYNSFAPLWYVLMCTNNNNGNALVLANIFKETNLFAAAEPSLMTDDTPDDIVPSIYHTNKTNIADENIKNIFVIENNFFCFNRNSNLLWNNLECSFYDANGKLKMSKHFNDNIGNISIDLTTLSDGIYICVVRIDGNKTLSAKFIK